MLSEMAKNDARKTEALERIATALEVLAYLTVAMGTTRAEAGGIMDDADDMFRRRESDKGGE